MEHYRSLKLQNMKKLNEINPSHDISILPFQPEDQGEVKRLILAGLAEHWGTLDLNKNPDLNDISRNYAKAVFLVARLNDQIVGTGALIPKSDDTAEVVRMSVVTNMRRKGIGRKILQRLYDHAKTNGYKRLVLETTGTWHEVIEFYKRFGFQITHYLDGDVYFALDVPETSK
jgi:putative acetyltransferase